MRGTAGMAGAAVHLRHWGRRLDVSETEWLGHRCALSRHARSVQLSAEESRMVVVLPGSPPLPRLATLRWALCRSEMNGGEEAEQAEREVVESGN